MCLLHTPCSRQHPSMHVSYCWRCMFDLFSAFCRVQNVVYCLLIYFLLLLLFMCERHQTLLICENCCNIPKCHVTSSNTSMCHVDRCCVFKCFSLPFTTHIPGILSYVNLMDLFFLNIFETYFYLVVLILQPIECWVYTTATTVMCILYR